MAYFQGRAVSFREGIQGANPHVSRYKSKSVKIGETLMIAMSFYRLYIKDKHWIFCLLWEYDICLGYIVYIYI